MADDLNQYALSRILGSQMKPIEGSVRFGNFGLLEATAEAVRGLKSSQAWEGRPKFTYDDDRLIVQAFEEVREGAAPDAILWNAELARAFRRRCRSLNLAAPDAFLNRRLINIRKDKTRYQKQGIFISPSTRTEPRPSIVPQYAHVVEFALVRLRYRYGASIDEILLNPALADQFEKLALTIAPDLSPEALRLGALYIRKSRNCDKDRIPKIKSLDIQNIESDWSEETSLATLSQENVPATAGLLELREGNRFLYVSRNENLRPAVGQFVNGRTFELMADRFWTPNLESITLRYCTGERKIEGVSIHSWECRLIHDLSPVFNWPIRAMAA